MSRVAQFQFRASPKQEARPRLEADAERYRFLRRMILRRTAAVNARGAASYVLTLHTPAPIDFDELDRILDACRIDDTGSKTEFTQGRVSALPQLEELEALTIDIVPDPPAAAETAAPEPRVPRRAPAKKPATPKATESSDAVTCRCGAVRPPTRGRQPKAWECGECVACVCGAIRPPTRGRRPAVWSCGECPEPVQCACGAVRPPTRGRRPAEWTCEACR